MEHRDRVILQKVLSEIEIAQKMMGNCSLEQFEQNEMLKRAVSMTVINIGELVKSLSEETRAAHTHIPWKAIAGFRDIAAHKYQTLRMEDVYETVAEDFPSLREQINKIL
ncbi:MAG: DUF86 domain-containing protein [Oscillospiraceae bacterium]|nr:DUF86 domain-containing protein [Oscillospiraceae bacterium]